MWLHLGICSGSNLVSCPSTSLLLAFFQLDWRTFSHLSCLLASSFSVDSHGLPLFLSPCVYEEQLSRAWPEVGCGWQAGCSHPTLSPLSGIRETGRWGQRRALSRPFSMPHIHTQAHKEALVPPRGAMLPKHTD